MSELIYSPGLEGVVAGETAISNIADGLRYRGYSIEDLAQHACFEEVAHLILHGDLPTAAQLDAFRGRLGGNAAVDPDLLKLLLAIPAATPLMDVLRTGTSTLAHWDPEATDISHDAQLRKAERLLAKLPTIMAAHYRLRLSEAPVAPDPDLSFAANVLWMIQHKVPSRNLERAMDVSLTLYAEHEFNASTFTSRVITSTMSDLHSAITGAIGALKGPLHGGANERVMAVLEEVGSPDNAEPWIRNALANKVRIMGFGHRVYKTGDPRAVYLKTFCRELAVESGREDLEQMADVIETIVGDEKGLPPNLDWPSARLYHYMGLEVDLYTPLFVLSRVVGWSAHVIEQLDNNRLIRPRSKYVGPGPRAWVPIEQR
ncbi:MAG: citrate synthase [Planctomycetota bacterium]|nr:citrate synthase [Planctomycetota bacterium]